MYWHCPSSNWHFFAPVSGQSHNTSRLPCLLLIMKGIFSRRNRFKYKNRRCLSVRSVPFPSPSEQFDRYTAEISSSAFYREWKSLLYSYDIGDYDCCQCCVRTPQRWMQINLENSARRLWITSLTITKILEIGKLCLYVNIIPVKYKKNSKFKYWLSVIL